MPTALQQRDIPQHINTLRELTERLAVDIERSRKLAPATGADFVVCLTATSLVDDRWQRSLTQSGADCSGAAARLCRDATAPDPSYDPSRDLAVVARAGAATMQRQRSSQKESVL